MISGYSEGPWRYEYTDDSDNNFVLSYVSMDADDEGRTRDYGGSLLEGLLTQDDHTNEANARLIAAAPDLLEACERALPQIRDALVIRQIQQAIALARGESRQ